MNIRMDQLEKDVASLKIMGWITMTCAAVSLAIRLWQIADATAVQSAPSGNSNAVHIGTAAPPDSAAADSRKTWLTTATVAGRENIAERTVIEWIDARRIHPAPEKAGRSWAISADYRILPPFAAPGGD